MGGFRGLEAGFGHDWAAWPHVLPPTRPDDQPTNPTNRPTGRFDAAGGRSLSDWIHADNLVGACLAAARGLTLAAGRVAAGQAYFANDGM